MFNSLSNGPIDEEAIAYVAGFTPSQRNILRGLLTAGADFDAQRRECGSLEFDRMADFCDDFAHVHDAHFNDEIKPLLLIELQKFERMDACYSILSRGHGLLVRMKNVLTMKL